MLRLNGCDSIAQKLAEKLNRDLSGYAPELIALASKRVQDLQEIDRRQPVSMALQTIQPLIESVSSALSDSSPPSVRTVCRDYRKWISAGRDIRAILFRYSDRGKRGTRMLPEVKVISDQVVDELFMTAERKRVPEVHLEIVRRLEEANEFRYGHGRLSTPSRRTVYREIARRSPYEVIVARYGIRRAEMAFRISGIGPITSRSLERVVMDHTPSDLIVVDVLRRVRQRTLPAT